MDFSPAFIMFNVLMLYFVLFKQSELLQYETSYGSLYYIHLTSPAPCLGSPQRCEPHERFASFLTQSGFEPGTFDRVGYSPTTKLPGRLDFSHRFQKKKSHSELITISGGLFRD